MKLCKQFHLCQDRFKCLTQDTYCHKPFLKGTTLIIPENQTVVLEESLSFTHVIVHGNLILPNEVNIRINELTYT